MIELLLMFLLGFCYDVVVIYWNHLTIIAKRPLHSAALSMTLGASSIIGISEAIHSTYGAFALVLGYGVGTFTVTKWLP